MYPNILTKWDLLSRKVDKNGVEAFKNMVQTRMDIKEKLHDPTLTKEEKKALKDQSGRYKLILNTTSGCMKDKFKKLYDPEFNTKMCMLGQLALTDLIFRLKSTPLKKKPSWARMSVEEDETWFKLVNSNTDGICIEVDNTEEINSHIDKIAHNWEEDWRFILEKTTADNLIQKDVNNYVFKDASGGIKVKGAYVTKYSDSNEQDTLAILAQAVVDYFLEGKEIRETIVDPSKPATDYQMIKKLGNMYDTPTWKKELGDEIVQKVNRIFPSTDTSLGGLYKHKKEKAEGTLDKVEGTPEHVLIINTDIRDKKIGELKNIDYEWYIHEAQQRVNDFLGIKREKKTRKRNNKNE